jgi:hypothetical protein
MRVEDLQATGRLPRIHGNGFIQFDLNEEGTKRLHVWHDSIPRQVTATPIHDHVFALKSRVIAGTLIHEVLDTVEGDTHRVFRAQQEEGTQNTILVPDEGTVALEVVKRHVLPTGSVYEFPAWELHQTEHYGLTTTIMDKIDAPKEYGRPRVLVPVGKQPDNEFKRDGHDPEFMWKLIDDALRLARWLEM